MTGAVVTIGRSRECDLAVRDKSLSRKHCRLEREAGQYLVRDLGSANGTRLNGTRLDRAQPLMTGDLIMLGRTRMLYVADTPQDREDDDIDAGQTICLDAISDDLAAENDGSAEPGGRFVLQYRKGGAKRILRLGKESVTLGRHASCSLIFDDKSVSSCHARIEPRGGQYMIFDLGSTNGVKVNGRKVEKAVLRPGTRIRVGNITLGFKEIVSRPKSESAPVADGAPVAVDADAEDAPTPPSLDAVRESAPAEASSSGPVDDKVDVEEAALSAQALSGDLGHAMNQVQDALADFDDQDVEDGTDSFEPVVEDASGSDISWPSAPNADNGDDVEGSPDQAGDAQHAPGSGAWVIRILAVLLLLAALAILFLFPGNETSTGNGTNKTNTEEPEEGADSTVETAGNENNEQPPGDEDEANEANHTEPQAVF